MPSARESLLRQRNPCVGIVKDRQPFAPGLRITRPCRLYGERGHKRLALIRHAPPQDLEASVTKAGEKSHAVELRERPGGVSDHGTDVFSTALAEEVRGNLLLAP